MLRNSLIAVLTVATATSAQQTFLTTAAKSNMEIYESALEVANVKDIQVGCQYLAGVNFYDLEPLYLNKPVYNITAYDYPGRYLLLSFCKNLPKEYWCNAD